MSTSSVWALIEGQPVTELPDDLYIPPQALEVLLDSFEGPLDLLLYLIKKQNIDILNIPIALITKQYMEYIEAMHDLQFELAAEYLVMAAMLAEIKSRMLLPHRVKDEDDEQDPRAELLKKLQEYEQMKQAAEDLDDLPRLNREVFTAVVDQPSLEQVVLFPEVSFEQLMLALKDVLVRMDNHAHHHIKREPLSIRERMAEVLDKLSNDKHCQFTELFRSKEGRLGLVVTFIAILELLKQSMIEIVQTKPFGIIHVKSIDE